MIYIDIHELINIVPDLINMFLPGYIFILIYGWMNAKKYNVTVLSIGSLFISYTISVFYTAVHNVILSSYDFNEAIKSLVYIASGLIFSLIVIRLQNTELYKKLMRKINHKSIHDDIFDDIIDYDKKTKLQIYLKSSPVIYIGTFKTREENGCDSYISLINYVSMNKNSKEIIFNPQEKALNSSVVINLRDIERIEVIYEKESKHWNYLSR